MQPNSVRVSDEAFCVETSNGVECELTDNTSTPTNPDTNELLGMNVAQWRSDQLSSDGLYNPSFPPTLDMVRPPQGDAYDLMQVSNYVNSQHPLAPPNDINRNSVTGRSSNRSEFIYYVFSS